MCEHNIRSEFVSVRPLAFEVPGHGEQGQLDGLYEVVDKFGVIRGESKASIGKPHYGTRQVGTNEQGNIIDARQGSDEYHKAIWANMQKRYRGALKSKKYGDDPDYQQQDQEGYRNAMHRALEMHKEWWTHDEDFSGRFQCYVSLPLLTAARYAYEKFCFTLDFESGYLPTYVYLK